jgi:peroxiredoxin
MTASVQTKASKGMIAAGDPAPDATLTDTEGAELTLSSLWKEKPVALVFLRHFGCIFCRENLALLKKDYPKFVEAGGQVACVGQGSHKVAKAIKILLDLPFPVLTCGDDLAIFREWGLERASFGQIFGPSVLIAAIKATLNGHKQTKVIGDGLQMPGAFVVDTKGIVRFVHRNKTAADHALNDDLLKAIQDIKKL